MPIGLRHVISGILAGGIPGFRMVLLLLTHLLVWPGDVFGFFRLFLLPYHVETIQCYHLLHELAHELAPVTPWFCGFVLCWCFCLLCLVGLLLVGVWFYLVVTSLRPSGL